MSRTAEFPLLVVDLGRLMRMNFDRRAAKFGLTRAQWRALKRLHRDEGLRQRELADLLEMEPIALGRTLDRLQKAGFVERRADPADRRAWRLYLTPRAHAVAGDMEVVAQEAIKDMLGGIRASDLTVALGVLEKVKANLQRTAEQFQEREDDD